MTCRSFPFIAATLQMVLLDAFIERAGADKVITGWRCTRVEHDESGGDRTFRGRYGQTTVARSAAASL